MENMVSARRLRKSMLKDVGGKVNLGDIGISIGQVKVDDKSNEITAIPDLLDLINIKDATITIDAIGFQEDIVNKSCKVSLEYRMWVTLELRCNNE